MKKNAVVYRDRRYVLGWEEDDPYLSVDGRKYRLTCHPYEPCLYLTDEEGHLTAVHNAFDPDSVLQAFLQGETVTSITGMEYDANDFCRMAEYAAGRYDIGIDDAEQVFGGRPQTKKPLPEKRQKEASPHGGILRPESGSIIEKDPFFDLMARYPDCVVDYCLVKNGSAEHGYDAHWKALVWACCKLFIDVDGSVIWHYDVGKAGAKPIRPEELFAPADGEGGLNYRKAFLHPPYGPVYSDADFDTVNAVLFPRGTDGLEVYQWTTAWSEYFDDGHEWWGTLCLTVYDRNLDRFVIILASATD